MLMISQRCLTQGFIVAVTHGILPFR